MKPPNVIAKVFDCIVISPATAKSVARKVGITEGQAASAVLYLKKQNFLFVLDKVSEESSRIPVMRYAVAEGAVERMDERRAVEGGKHAHAPRHDIHAKPRQVKPAPSSGQEAGRCISRQYKWFGRMPW